jgi:hypothetical protein
MGLDIFGLGGTVVLGIVAIILMIISVVVLWLLGLIVAFCFLAISVALLYALHKMDALDVQKQPWLLAFPVLMFFLGLGLNKLGVLQVQPLSFSSLATDLPVSLISTEAMFFLVIVALLIIDIWVGLTER